MKHICFSVLLLFIGLAYGMNITSTTNPNKLNENFNVRLFENELEDSGSIGMDGLKKKAQRLSDGLMDSGLNYFDGILAYVVLIDYNFNLMDTLDAQDVVESKFHEHLNLCKSYISDLRKAMVLYKKSPFPKRSQFDKITHQWVDCVESIIDNHIVPLVNPMSRPDNTWTDSEFDLWDKYSAAFDKYLKIDQKWVDYQDVFAAANNFEISGVIDYETIDK